MTDDDKKTVHVMLEPHANQREAIERLRQVVAEAEAETAREPYRLSIEHRDGGVTEHVYATLQAALGEAVLRQVLGERCVLTFPPIRGRS